MTPADLLTPTGICLAIFALLIAALVAIGVVNLFAFRRPRALIAGGDAALPRVSALVPVRNDQDVIERCVRSLLAQNYPDFEVVVLDDNSSDATYDILCKLRDQDYRLRVLAGAMPSEESRRRAFALRQLANASSGRYLLLTDAQREFSPDAFLMAVGAASEYDADVVSLAPKSEASARLGFLPLPLVRGSRSPLFAAASELFIFLERATYFELTERCDETCERADAIAFAKHVKWCGKTLWFGDGSRVYRTAARNSAGRNRV